MEKEKDINSKIDENSSTIEKNDVDENSETIDQEREIIEDEDKQDNGQEN